MKLVSLLVAIIFSAPAVYAMDLAEMQAMALNNRQVVNQFVANLEQREKEMVLARGGYYPAVDLVYTTNALKEATLLEDKVNTVAVGRISWNVFAGFRDKFTLLSAERQREVDRYRLQGIKQDLQLNVALAYLGVSERRANRQVAEAAYQTLSRIYRDGENRYKVGLIGKNELLKFRVDYDNADIAFKEAEAGLSKSVNELSRQVGSELALADLDFADFAIHPPLMDREAQTKKMLAGRSEIKALESVIEASAARAEAERSGYYPRVDLVGSYSRYGDDRTNAIGDGLGASLRNEEELRAQMVVSINLFQGFTTEASVARARLDTRSFQYQLAELKNDLTTDLHNLHTDFKVSLENVEAAKGSIEQAEENLRITELKYREGLQRESELLDAITSLSRAKYQQVAVVRTAFSNNFQLVRMVDGF